MQMNGAQALPDWATAAGIERVELCKLEESVLFAADELPSALPLYFSENPVMDVPPPLTAESPDSAPALKALGRARGIAFKMMGEWRERRQDRARVEWDLNVAAQKEREHNVAKAAEEAVAAAAAPEEEQEAAPEAEQEAVAVVHAEADELHAPEPRQAKKLHVPVKGGPPRVMPALQLHERPPPAPMREAERKTEFFGPHVHPSEADSHRAVPEGAVAVAPSAPTYVALLYDEEVDYLTACYVCEDGPVGRTTSRASLEAQQLTLLDCVPLPLGVRELWSLPFEWVSEVTAPRLAASAAAVQIVDNRSGRRLLGVERQRWQQILQLRARLAKRGRATPRGGGGGGGGSGAVKPNKLLNGRALNGGVGGMARTPQLRGHPMRSRPLSQAGVGLPPHAPPSAAGVLLRSPRPACETSGWAKATLQARYSGPDSPRRPNNARRAMAADELRRQLAPDRAAASARAQQQSASPRNAGSVASPRSGSASGAALGASSLGASLGAAGWGKQSLGASLPRSMLNSSVRTDRLTGQQLRTREYVRVSAPSAADMHV